MLGFAFAAFAITWAWVNFSWFASAYDTDDWVYRLTTMLQMVGVVILALGLPTMFESIDEGETVNNGVMVAGYVVMRVGMVFQWARAARQDPRAPLGVQDVHRHDPDRPGRLAGAAVRAHDAWRETFIWVGRAGRASSSPARGSPSGARAARRGTRTTSPSATGCS